MVRGQLVTIFVCSYVGVGVVGALVLFVRRVDIGLGRGPTALVALLLWPFVLPGALSGKTAQLLSTGPHAETISALARRLHEAWLQVGSAGVQRDRRVLEVYVERLLQADARIAALTSAEREAPPSVKARLGKMKEAAEAELHSGLGLMEDLLAQLMLLRFSELKAPAEQRAERDRIETLLAQLESMATLQEEDVKALSAGMRGSSPSGSLLSTSSAPSVNTSSAFTSETDLALSAASTGCSQNVSRSRPSHPALPVRR